jgi:hypothetical protein
LLPVSIFSRKKSAVDRRLQKVERELTLVNRDLRVLSKTVRKSSKPTDFPALRSLRNEADASPAVSAPAGAPAAETDVSAEPDRRRAGGRRIPDERFSDYLASSMQGTRPLRHERRIQRNKAILMIVFVLVVLVLLLSHWFL